ncbi:aspartyl protease family protein [bacterium]|nr:aspartyl protease family protein [bacterium]
MKKAVAFVLLIITISLVAETAPPEVVQLVEAYKNALNLRSIEPLLPYLDKDFDFSGAGPEVSSMVFEQIISMGVLQIGEVKSVEIERHGDQANVTITAELVAGDNMQETNDEFGIIMRDGVWKISRMGTGALQALVVEDPTKDMGFAIDGPALSEVKFADDLDHIVVEAFFHGGEKVNLIVDNGTPLSVLDSEMASRFAPVGNMVIAKAMGVSGDIENTGAVTIDSVILGDIVVTNLMAITMDLSHLSTALDVEIAGLLGSDFLGKFAWTIDYSSRKLFLSRLDEKGQLIDPEDKILSREPTHTIGFDRKLHLLYTTAQFAKGHSGYIVLDCGAGGGVMTPEFFNDLPRKSYKSGESDTLVGADKKRTPVESVYPKKLIIGPVVRNDYPVVISDLSHINSLGLPTAIDAIIGYNFFKDWLITTWFEKNIIELRPIPK